MNYIVFDLEWNQASSEAALVTEPVYLDGEIIEIGAVKLDGHFKIIDELRLYIKPQYYKKMHHAVASLTGISDRMLEQQGLSFPEAYEKFAAWCGEDYGYMTWSDSDLPILIDNMVLHGIDASVMPPCFDAQRIFDREIMRTERQLSLDAALEVLGETGEKAHDALHDAKNTVRVCDHMELEEYIDEYGARVFVEKPILKVYDSVTQILQDPEAASVTCPWCGEIMTCRDWVPLSHHRYAAMGSCGEEDEFLLYISTFPSPGGGFRISRLLYEMSDDLWDQYQDRLEALAVN